MRIGLLSDTHGFLDDAVFHHFAECDEVWHAGDFGTTEVLDRLRAFKPVRGVYGNVDGSELRADLPEDLVWECEGLNVYMTHIGGYPGNYDRRAGKEVRRLRPGLFICGHSHILKVMRDQALGLVHMNPGACGHNGWHLVRTLLRFTVEGGKISGVQAIELGPRGRGQPSEKQVEPRNGTAPGPASRHPAGTRRRSGGHRLQDPALDQPVYRAQIEDVGAGAGGYVHQVVHDRPLHRTEGMRHHR